MTNQHTHSTVNFPHPFSKHRANLSFHPSPPPAESFFPLRANLPRSFVFLSVSSDPLPRRQVSAVQYFHNIPLPTICTLHFHLAPRFCPSVPSVPLSVRPSFCPFLPRSPFLGLGFIFICTYCFYSRELVPLPQPLPSVPSPLFPLNVTPTLYSTFLPDFLFVLLWHFSYIFSLFPAPGFQSPPAFSPNRGSSLFPFFF